MAGNDVPLDVLLDRTVQQLEHAEADADRRLELLKRVAPYFHEYGNEAIGANEDKEYHQLLFELNHELAKELADA